MKGLGQRDKSWGHRDWHIESWYVLHAQFDSLSIETRPGVVNGVAHVSGDTSSTLGHVAISEADPETGFTDAEARMPTRVTTRIYGVDRSGYTLHSSLISPSSFVRFSRPLPSGTTELFEDMATHKREETSVKGTGLMEWLSTCLEEWREPQRMCPRS